MRRFLLNLTVCIVGAIVALTPAITQAQPRSRGSAPDQLAVNDSVRQLLTDNNLTCQFQEARFVGRNTSNGRTLYEVACSNEPGFLLVDSAPAEAINCIANNASVAARRAEDPDAETGSECSIPSNIDVVAAVAPYVQSAGITCGVDQARWIGTTSQGSHRYEVGCPSSEGYWFDVDASGQTSNVMSCLRAVAGGGTCQFTSAQEQASWLAAMAASSGRSCQANAARWVGQNDGTGQIYREVGCSDGVGFMVRTDRANTFESVIECSAASGIAGGCTLSEAAAVAVASTEELQARLASAGISCSYIDNRSPRQETSGDRRTVVEFACSERPWGLVAFLPNDAGSPESIDCLTAQARIGGCSLTTRNMLRDHLVAVARILDDMVVRTVVDHVHGNDLRRV